MDADRAHALVARCLTEPAFLAAALAHAHAQGRPGPAARGAVAELERLALFAGFITKVKHNPLRVMLPCTLRLLAILGDEVAFFARYAPAYAARRAGGPLPLARQVELLRAELQAFVRERPARLRTALDDVLAHEGTLARLGADTAGESDTAGQRAADDRNDADDAGSVRWRGRFALGRYATDVVATCSALGRRAFDLGADVLEREHLLAYWRPAGAADVSYFEVDELTGVLFGLVDGRRTAADIAGVLAASGLDMLGPAEVAAFFADAAQRGFVAPGAPACA